MRCTAATTTARAQEGTVAVSCQASTQQRQPTPQLQHTTTCLCVRACARVCFAQPEALSCRSSVSFVIHSTTNSKRLKKFAPKPHKSCTGHPAAERTRHRCHCDLPPRLHRRDHECSMSTGGCTFERAVTCNAKEVSCQHGQRQRRALRIERGVLGWSGCSLQGCGHLWQGSASHHICHIRNFPITSVTVAQCRTAANSGIFQFLSKRCLRLHSRHAQRLPQYFSGAPPYPCTSATHYPRMRA